MPYVTRSAQRSKGERVSASGDACSQGMKEREGMMGLRNFALTVSAAWLALFCAGVRADEPVEADPHAHHHQMMEAPAPVRRSEASYPVPSVHLVRDDGRSVTLRDELAGDRPVVLAFIYTSCTSVCPLTSQTLSQLQSRLGAARDQVNILSISIDPEQDTPTRLAEYAQTFHAGPEWRHYTGTLAASQTAQRAFDVYRGNKMNHSPAILVRPTAESRWVRFDGFATVDQLMAELPLSKMTSAAR